MSRRPSLQDLTSQPPLSRTNSNSNSHHVSRPARSSHPSTPLASPPPAIPSSSPTHLTPLKPLSDQPSFSRAGSLQPLNTSVHSGLRDKVSAVRQGIRAEKENAAPAGSPTSQSLHLLPIHELLNVVRRGKGATAQQTSNPIASSVNSPLSPAASSQPMHDTDRKHHPPQHIEPVGRTQYATAGSKLRSAVQHHTPTVPHNSRYAATEEEEVDVGEDIPDSDLNLNTIHEQARAQDVTAVNPLMQIDEADLEAEQQPSTTTTLPTGTGTVARLQLLDPDRDEHMQLRHPFQKNTEQITESYVESKSTGEFVRVKMRDLEATLSAKSPRPSSSPSPTAAEMDADVEALVTGVNQSQTFLQLAFLLANGFLMGLLVAQSYIVYSRSSHVQFLTYYSPFVVGLRQMAFVLLNVIVPITLWRTLLEARGRTDGSAVNDSYMSRYGVPNRSRWHLARNILQLLCFTVALLCTLWMVKVEDFIHENYVADGVWYLTSLPSYFTDQLDRYYGVVVFRMLCVVIAWVLIATRFVSVEHTYLSHDVLLRTTRRYYGRPSTANSLLSTKTNTLVEMV